MKKSLIAAAILAFASGSASAEKLIYKKNHWAEYEEKVQSYTEVYVYDTGKVIFRTKFSNGMRLYPTDALISTRINDKQGNFIWGCTQWVHRLQPSFGGSAGESEGDCTKNIGPSLARAVVSSAIMTSQATPEMAAYSNKLLEDFRNRNLK